jgi:hypothetical protein
MIDIETDRFSAAFPSPLAQVLPPRGERQHADNDVARSRRKYYSEHYKAAVRAKTLI